MFFSFDGLDGVGKTTQIELFCGWLRELGHDVVQCRDPGSTAIGESIRELLLGQRGEGMSLRAEMLLYMAARAQLVDEIIRPALNAGHFVVSDRFLLANVVYQGHAGGLDPGTIWKAGQIAIGGLEPSLTFLLDMPPEGAQLRIGRELDRLERRGSEYRARLRDGYLEEAGKRPEQIVVINADREVDAIQEEIRDHARRRLRQSAR